MRITVQAVGIEQAQAMLGSAARNCSDLRYAQPIVNQLLFVMYDRKWRRWGDYMYETGRLRESWTDDASADAIREAHYDRIDYGSRVPYARFFTSQLLEVDAKSENDLAEAMADYFAGARLVTGHMRSGSWVTPYVRSNVALASAHS